MITSDEQIYENLRTLIRKFDSTTYIIKASENDLPSPDLTKGNPFCVIQHFVISNRTAVRERSVTLSSGTFTIATRRQKKVMIQFDFFGNNEKDTLDLANKFNQGLAYFLQGDPYSDMGLDGEVESVENFSDMLPNKNYRHRFSFRLKLLVVYGVDFKEDLITSVQGVEHKVIVR